MSKVQPSGKTMAQELYDAPTPVWEGAAFDAIGWYYDRYPNATVLSFSQSDVERYAEYRSAHQNAALRQRIEDLNEVLEDKRRLTRELDVAMHGEEGAAKQASLCDLVLRAEDLRAELESLRKERDALREKLNSK